MTMTNDPLSPSELDALQAGCGSLVITGRLDAGAALDPVWAFLKRRPRSEAVQALKSAEQVYRTRIGLGVDDAIENRRRADQLMLAAKRW